MKIKLEQLVAIADFPNANGEMSQGSLSKLLSKELPIKTAYTLGKLFIKIKSELQQYYQYRDNLIKKYGKEENGKYSIESSNENFEEFKKGHIELLSIPVDINFEPLELESLGDIKLSAMDMGNLEMFFKT